MVDVWRKKLLEVIEERGIKPKPFSLKIGRNETFLRDILKDGGSSPSIDNFQAIADELMLPMSFFFGGDMPPPSTVPVVGYASGGEEWEPVDDLTEKAGLDTIPLDLSEVDPIAIRVRGPSMFPVFRNGDDLICSRQRGTDMRNTIGKDCVVKTLDGRCYIKSVLQGTTRNTFRLRSYNQDFADMDNESLEWSAPVIWIKRKQ